MRGSNESHIKTVNPLFQFRAHHPDNCPLLVDGRAARALKVLVDAPTWARLQQSEDLPDILLRTLLQGEQIVMTLYADDGPPDEAERRPIDSLFGGGEAIGWTVTTMTDDQMVPYEITTATDKSATVGALLDGQIFAARTALELERGTADERDVLLIAVAQSIGVDLLLTERLPLLNTRLVVSGNCQVAAPADALAVVALYLRAAGEFITVKLDSWSFTATPTRFYQQLAEAHVPSLAEFVHRAEDRVSAARLLTVLTWARSLFRSRDRIALLTSEPVTEDVADEISIVFTHALVDIVAFHDVLARIVNEFLVQPEMEPRLIKWQNAKWCEQAVEQFPELRIPWTVGGYAKSLNHALRVMRNEIHDVAPSILPFKENWGAAHVGLAFHVDVGSRVKNLLGLLTDARGDGVWQIFTDGHLVDPHLFYEFVLPWVLRSVDDVLQALLGRLPERAPNESSSLLPDDVRDEALRAVARVVWPQ